MNNATKEYIVANLLKLKLFDQSTQDNLISNIINLLEEKYNIDEKGLRVYLNYQLRDNGYIKVYDYNICKSEYSEKYIKMNVNLNITFDEFKQIYDEVIKYDTNQSQNM